MNISLLALVIDEKNAGAQEGNSPCWYRCFFAIMLDWVSLDSNEGSPDRLVVLNPSSGRDIL